MSIEKSEGNYPIIDESIFTEYVRANTEIPQVADGIKWITHSAILNKPFFNGLEVVSSRFSKDQLELVRERSDRAHKAFQIPVIVASEADNVDPSLTPIYDNDYARLWTRVTHSFFYHLYYFLKAAHEDIPAVEMGYKNDLAHDLVIPSLLQISQVESALIQRNSLIATYQNALGIISDTTKTPEGKDLLRRYRERFRQGEKTSKVWHSDGFGDEFAHLVEKSLKAESIDKNDKLIQDFLFLNNLSQYSVFSDHK